MATCTAEGQIREALISKGYRLLARHTGNRDTAVRSWLVYSNGKHTPVLQVLEDGGCEVYRPLTDSITTADTIAAIP